MTEQKTVLIVDDMPANIKLVSQLLKTTYKTKVATNGEKALQIALTGTPPDLILLDVQMPGMNGYEVCKKLKAQEATRDIPVIFFTGSNDMKDLEIGFEAGASDFITKPLSPSILYARVRNHLELKEAHEVLNRRDDMQSTIRKLNTTRDVTLLAMGSLAEARTSETDNHILRTAYFVKTLAEQLQAVPRFRELITPEYIQLLFTSAPLHDIGKAAIPDSILLKPGKLTDEEFEEIKKHTSIGRDALLAAERQVGATAPFLDMARNMACSHHERWDGTGYPDGLKGEAIPIPGRLMMVADVYDALVTHRIYKPAFSHGVAVEIIQDGRGTQFDPEVVDAVLASETEFRKITLAFADFEKERKHHS